MVPPSADEACTATRIAFEQFKIVVEPVAAVGLAVILSGKFDIRDKIVDTIATGGNIDPDKFCDLLKT